MVQKTIQIIEEKSSTELVSVYDLPKRVMHDVASSTNNKDLPTKAGNRLYSQALERQKRHEEMREEAWKVEESRFNKQNELRDSSSDMSKPQDLSVEAGNRLYTQAIERLKRHEARRQEASEASEENKSSSQEEVETAQYDEAFDLTVKAGNRLYTQAIEQLRRHEARRQEESKESARSSTQSSLCDDQEVVIKAGNRLYQEALAQFKRLETRRMEATKVKPAKLELPTQTSVGLRIQAAGSRNLNDETKSNSSDGRNGGGDRCDHLYHLSHEMQLLGKQRRSLIEEEKAKAKEIPETKVLPASKASDMYNRSVERLIAQKIKLAEKAAKYDRN